MESPVKYNYSLDDDIIVINSLYIEQKQRRQGLGTSFLEKLEREGKEKGCIAINTPSDLSKIALSFWLKNGFLPSADEDWESIRRVLSSKKAPEHIHDIDHNTVVQLEKKI